MLFVPAREVPGNTRLRVGRKDDRAVDVNLRLTHVVIGLGAVRTAKVLVPSSVPSGLV